MTTYSDIKRQYGRNVGREKVRQVWAEVTKTPQAGVREIGERLGLGYGSVATALRILQRAGYIEFSPGSHSARTVVVPFVIVRKEPPCSTD